MAGWVAKSNIGPGLLTDWKRPNGRKVPPGWPPEVKYTDVLVLNPKLFHIFKSGHDLTPGVQICKLPETHPAAEDCDGARGLFASMRFEAQQTIGHYTGLVKERVENDASQFLFPLSDDGEGWDVDASEYGNELRFINDYRAVAGQPNAVFEVCCDPRTRMRVVKVMALRAIARHSEVVIDYETHFRGLWVEAYLKKAEQRLIILRKEEEKEIAKRDAQHRCVCGVPYSDDAAYLCCDHCNIWFHFECVGLAKNAKLKGSWFCPSCEKKISVATVFQDYAGKEVAVRVQSGKQVRGLLLYDYGLQAAFVSASADDGERATLLSLAEFEALGKAKSRKPEASIYAVDDGDQCSLLQAAVKAATGGEATSKGILGLEGGQYHISQCPATNNETLTEMARDLGVTDHMLLQLNKHRYTGLKLTSRLIQGTLVSFAFRTKDHSADDDDTLTRIARKLNSVPGC